MIQNYNFTDDPFLSCLVEVFKRWFGFGGKVSVAEGVTSGSSKKSREEETSLIDLGGGSGGDNSSVEMELPPTLQRGWLGAVNPAPRKVKDKGPGLRRYPDPKELEQDPETLQKDYYEKMKRAVELRNQRKGECTRDPRSYDEDAYWAEVEALQQDAERSPGGTSICRPRRKVLGKYRRRQWQESSSADPNPRTDRTEEEEEQSTEASATPTPSTVSDTDTLTPPETLTEPNNSTPTDEVDFGTFDMGNVGVGARSAASNVSIASLLQPRNENWYSPVSQSSLLSLGSLTRDRFSTRSSTGSVVSIPGEFLKEVLNNDKMEYIEVEGYPYCKRMLAEWGAKYLKHYILHSTSEGGTQTEIEPGEPERFTVTKMVECKPDCVNASTQTDHVDCVETSTKTDDVQSEPNAGATSATMSNPTRSGTNSAQPVVLNQQSAAPVTTIPPLMANYSHNLTTPSLLGNWTNYGAGQQQSASTLHPAQYQLRSIQQYEEALKWKPNDESKKEAFEQAKKDIFNVIMVYRGCSVKSFTIQENLDLDKIGVPDLKTLLVHMQDNIVLKKERYTGEKYLFPNFASDDFETVAHIGELVAEQRDKEPLPNPALLIDCDMRELFEQRQVAPQQLQTTYTRGNSHFYNHLYASNMPYLTYQNPNQASYHQYMPLYQQQHSQPQFYNPNPNHYTRFF